MSGGGGGYKFKAICSAARVAYRRGGGGGTGRGRSGSEFRIISIDGFVPGNAHLVVLPFLVDTALARLAGGQVHFCGALHGGHAPRPKPFPPLHHMYGKVDKVALLLDWHAAFNVCSKRPCMGHLVGQCN